MLRIKMNESELVELELRIKTTTEQKIWKRYVGMSMINKGVQRSLIAESLHVCQETVRNWIKIYHEGGLDGLAKLNYDERSSSKLDKHKKDMEGFVENNICCGYYQLQSFVNNVLGVDIGYDGVYKFSKKNLICDSGNRKKSHSKRLQKKIR